jgi:hypothetical protein
MRKTVYTEAIMKRWLLVFFALLSAPAFAQSVPVIRYDSVPNAVRLP